MQLLCNAKVRCPEDKVGVSVMKFATRTLVVEMQTVSCADHSVFVSYKNTALVNNIHH